MKPKNYVKAFLGSCLVLMTLVSSIRAQATDVAIVKQPAVASSTETEKDMAQLRHEITEQMKAQDVELTKLIGEMNEASGDAKLKLMASILTQMAQQRSDRDARMELMQERVMQYMIAAGYHDDKSSVAPQEKNSK